MLAAAGRQTADAIRREYAEVYREMRARRLHGGRRVPLPRARRRPAPPPRPPTRPASRSCCLYVAYARGGIDAVPPGVGRRVPATGSRSCAPRASASASPPTPCAPARRDWLEELGALRRTSTACRCTCTPTSSRARSRSASPSTACGRSSCSRETGCLGPAHDRRARARTPTAHELDLLARRRLAHLRLPDDRGEPRRRLPARRARAAPRDRALHRLRLERADRPARGASRARGHRAPADAAGAA